MSVEIFTENHFQSMPWKNGEGVTTELFRLNDGDSFKLRFSIANVNSSGPFSTFNNIDRALLLLDGTGFRLVGTDLSQYVIDDQDPIYFAGENPIHCTLLLGKCRDFNVMTKRNFANSKLSVIKAAKDKNFEFESLSDLKFIYDKEKNILYKLSRGDKYSICPETPTTLIVTEVTFL